VNKRIEKDEVNKGWIKGEKKYPKMDIKQYSNGMRFDVVVVLGMHRSGTSAITKGLELFGMDLGQNLLAANEYNPKGYFEDNQLVNINDNILRKSGSLWSALQFLEPADLFGARFIKRTDGVSNDLASAEDVIYNFLSFHYLGNILHIVFHDRGKRFFQFRISRI
jgi:hypothetical protein